MGLSWDYIGTLEKKIEAIGTIVVILKGPDRGSIEVIYGERKEHGNSYDEVISGLGTPTEAFPQSGRKIKSPKPSGAFLVVSIFFSIIPI